MNNDVLKRKLFRKSQARDKLREMGGIMASSPELMQTVQKFSAGSGPMGVRANQPTFGQMFGGPKVNRPEIRNPFSLPSFSNIQIDPYARNVGSDLGTGIMTSIRDYLIPGNATRRLAASEDIGATQSINTIPAPQSEPSVPNIFSSAQADEVAAQPEPEVAAQPEPETSSPIAEMNENEVVMPRPTAPQTADELEADDRDVATSAVTDAAAVVDSNLPKPVQGAVIADTVKKIVNMQGLSAKEISEQVQEITGQKDPDKNISRDERIKNNIELYKRLFKEDPKDIKTENGFNLAFMGFAIAAGKDSNALTNLAEGAKQGLSKFADSAKARKQRERDAKVFGLTQTLKEEDDVRKQRQRMMELKFGANVDLIKQRFATEADMAKWAATQTIAERQLNRKLNASVQELGLRLDAADKQNIISNLPEASVLWLQQNPEATVEDLSKPETVDEMANLAIRLSPGSRGKTPDPGKTRPAYIQEGVAKATEDPGTRFNIAQALGKPVEQLTTQDIQNYYGGVWDSSSGQGGTAGTTINLDPEEG
jgi:hypothetical protein